MKLIWMRSRVFISHRAVTLQCLVLYPLIYLLSVFLAGFICSSVTGFVSL